MKIEGRGTLACLFVYIQLHKCYNGCYENSMDLILEEGLAQSVRNSVSLSGDWPGLEE